MHHTTTFSCLYYGIAQHNQTIHRRFPIDRSSSSSRRLYPPTSSSTHKNKTNSTAQLSLSLSAADQTTTSTLTKRIATQKSWTSTPHSHLPAASERVPFDSADGDTTRRRVPAGAPRRSYPSIHVFRHSESVSSSTPVSLAAPTPPAWTTPARGRL